MVKGERFLVPVENLRRVCDYEKELAFCRTTLDVEPLEGVIGQDRAERAMQFGLAMDAQGYNIFVVGPQGIGKSTYVQSIVNQVAAKASAPDDWCYIHNFNDQDKPLAVSLPACQGRVFQKDMEDLIADLKQIIPKAFEGGEYDQQKDTLVQSIQQKMEGLFREIEKEALEAGFNLKQTPKRFVFIPLRDGKMLTPEEYEQLPTEDRKLIDEKGRKLEKRLEDTFHEGKILEKRVNEQLVELDKRMTNQATEPLLRKLIEKYEAYPKIKDYLETVLKDITDHYQIFRSGGAPQNPQPMVMPLQANQEESEFYVRYKVNLFVNNEKCTGAPVIVEASPYYYNLVGKIEYRSQMLAVSTDFTMVKAGALQQANGGYLILQAKDVLMDPFAWDALKKALRYRHAVVENIGEQYRYVPTVTLRPEPIPLNLKIILIGSPLFYLYFTMDEDFQKYFKVKVDFDVDVPRTPETLRQYAAFVSSLCRRENLKHFNQSGLGKLIEFCSALADDQSKLSTRFNAVTEVVYEADKLAKIDGAEFVEAYHVDKAVQERKYRSNKLEEKIQELIVKGIFRIETEGTAVGQVNGLSVIELGGYSFGRPSRITARTYAGRGGIINIERETDMSGTIHSKGVLTLAGYLGGKFAQNKPLSMTAQITFEQSYEGVDGDSASSSELYTILSSLADVPLKQNLAVTGSIDQYGRIQPIGGTTEKIEGFFDICKAKGLTGDQGVMIPVQNISHLMLKDEVLAAVKEKRFHLYAVASIEEGIEVLSDLPAGVKDAEDNYSEDSVFGRVEQKLATFAKGLEAAVNKEKGKDKELS